MFSGGDTGVQTSQDDTTVDAAVVSDNNAGASDTSQPASVPPIPADVVPPVEAAELPVVVPPESASVDSAPLAVDDLFNIKQQALQQLSPLLGHLDQSPEERFRTTMMMIQASDNSALLKTAYEAAQQIPDEKTRAQALLDVVNEINYFTQHDGDSEPAAS